MNDDQGKIEILSRDDEMARQHAGGVAFICHEDRPEDATVRLDDPGRPVRPHRSGGQRIASMQSIAFAALLTASSVSQDPNTGRNASIRNSQRMEEERLRLREQRERHVGFHPNLAAPYGKPQGTTPEDLARIAAAEAKRARKAAKKGSK